MSEKTEGGMSPEAHHWDAKDTALPYRWVFDAIDTAHEQDIKLIFVMFPINLELAGRYSEDETARDAVNEMIAEQIETMLVIEKTAGAHEPSS